MSKYIDKDELWERLKKRMVHHIVTNTLFNTIKAVIESLPTIDIVHCEECEFEWTQKCPPHRMGLIHEENDYCSYGIRKGMDNE